MFSKDGSIPKGKKILILEPLTSEKSLVKKLIKEIGAGNKRYSETFSQNSLLTYTFFKYQIFIPLHLILISL